MRFVEQPWLPCSPILSELSEYVTVFLGLVFGYVSEEQKKDMDNEKTGLKCIKRRRIIFLETTSRQKTTCRFLFKIEIYPSACCLALPAFKKEKSYGQAHMKR